MNINSIEDIASSTDRYKLYVLRCDPSDLPSCIDFLQTKGIAVINIGKELASYIGSLEDFSYLNIDVYDHAKKLLDTHKSQLHNSGNEVVAIYNVGILLEPRLELNAAKLLKEFSKSAALIIIWENQSEVPDRLHWPTQKNNFFLDFSESKLKELHYEV